MDILKSNNSLEIALVLEKQDLENYLKKKKESGKICNFYGKIIPIDLFEELSKKLMEKFETFGEKMVNSSVVIIVTTSSFIDQFQRVLTTQKPILPMELVMNYFVHHLEEITSINEPVKEFLDELSEL
ncbi:MAG: hypothetical protein PHE43_02355 [Candidatus Nanoarchaeia archaeon]|nr:hypothetical protein [Candidatus Nanoarchaeia archaeon]